MGASKLAYVLVVDDSRMFRELIKGMLDDAAHLAVVGEAVNGKEALLKTQALKPDIVVMDIRMPVMDGLEAVERIMDLCPTPILICSGTLQDMDVNIAMTAMKMGAMEVIEKPTGFSDEILNHFKTGLLEKIRLLTQIKAVRHTPRRHVPAPDRRILRPLTSSSVRAVGVGASTGGPKALSTLLSGLNPSSFEGCILLVQHLSKSFADGYVRWLATETSLRVKQARHGDPLERGLVLVAPPGEHMVLWRDVVHLNRGEPVNGCCPAIDVLFESIARWQEDRAIGVILTGMGRDGADGALAIKGRKGYVIAQNEETCTIFGMPKAAIELNAATAVLPVGEIPTAITRLMREGGTPSGRGG